MKKLFLILAAACLLTACSHEKLFKISGTITDLGNPDEPVMLYLKTRTADNQLINLDSAYLSQNGTFVLKGRSSETDLFFLANEDNRFFVRIFVDPGNKITVSGSANDLASIIIEGSKTQALYDKYFSLLAEIQEKQAAIKQDFYTYLQDPSMSEEMLQQIQEELIAAYEQLEEDAMAITLQFISDNSNNVVAAYLVFRNTDTSNNSAEIEEQLSLLNPEMNNKFVAMIKARLEKVKQKEVGTTLPNIELPDAEGKIISLESLRGKYVLVDFWASWCRPCIAEIPNLKKAYEKYHDKGFEIFGISLDDSREAWLNGIARYEINWINVSDLKAFESPVTDKLAVSYVPHTFLLDPNGVVLAVDLRGNELENILAERLQ
jgi:peroxiredoxin